MHVKIHSRNNLSVQLVMDKIFVAHQANWNSCVSSSHTSITNIDGHYTLSGSAFTLT